MQLIKTISWLSRSKGSRALASLLLMCVFLVEQSAFAESHIEEKLQVAKIEFQQGSTVYQRITNAYVASAEKVKATKKSIRKQMVPYSVSGQQKLLNEITESIVVKKGGFAVLLKSSSSDKAAMSVTGKSATQAPPSLPEKAPLRNKISGQIAILSNTILVGVDNEEQANKIAQKYSIQLVKVLGIKNKTAIYKVPIDDVFSTVEAIRAQEGSSIRYARADIMENFAVPQ